MEIQERLIASERKELIALRDAWDKALAVLGGDPTATDWSTFAPLRREREEDWSDWLAQLLSDSRTGAFAHRLFGAFDGRPADDFASPRVCRELTVEDRRADLVIDWRDGSYTHVEVKVGDPHIEKTKDTAVKVARAARRGARGRDVLLVLPEQEVRWEALRRASPELTEAIALLTWRDVAVALRACLPSGASQVVESVRWSVWAHALAGAVEQELLQFPRGDQAKAWCDSVPSERVEHVVAVLRTAWHSRV
jgi:hypothetical protein